MPTAARKTPPRMKGVTPPPFTIPAHLQTRNHSAEPDEPLLIRIFTWYLVIRAALFLVAALFLFGPPDNPLSAFLIGHAALFTRRLPISTSGPDAATAIQNFLGGYCVFFGLLYSLTAWRWIVRHWLARWALMFLAGATAIKTVLAVAIPDAVLYILGSVPVGNPFPLTRLQLSLLVVSACLNLAICFYLMFYPGVEKTFERPFQ
ncbi:MAG TPA: hypothetical protein VG844_00530 [Terracidiphilus sp.]|nr:hypothetical protein [Terracidiphilus sp.]